MNPTAAIAVELRSALAGRPNVGDWDVMFPWLTIDDTGFPHGCLLSRAELDADRDRVHAVLASPATISNLRRHPQATLVGIDKHAATYAKLTVARTLTTGPGPLAARVPLVDRLPDQSSGGLRPQAVIIGEVARSSFPARTLARCSSISPTVAMPPPTSRSRICSKVARSSSLPALPVMGKYASAVTSTSPSARKCRGSVRP
ncbi:MAG: hypothetical protein JWQ60_3099 [Pseudonocardia sp.]|nr:hypothetical protein [Pseudonocardia sp.]